jgi:hypothetical protein
MSITIRTVEDLIRVLEEHPEWRERLLAVLLGQEFLQVPARLDRIEAVLERLVESHEQLCKAIGSCWRATNSSGKAIGSCWRATNSSGKAIGSCWRAIGSCWRATSSFGKAIASCRKATSSSGKAISRHWHG